MIKLLRNTRKKLLSEGKTTNYIKFAIGEIVLVAIHIFLPKFKRTNEPFPSLEGIKGWTKL